MLRSLALYPSIYFSLFCLLLYSPLLFILNFTGHNLDSLKGFNFALLFCTFIYRFFSFAWSIYLFLVVFNLISCSFDDATFLWWCYMNLDHLRCIANEFRFLWRLCVRMVSRWFFFSSFLFRSNQKWRCINERGLSICVVNLKSHFGMYAQCTHVCKQRDQIKALVRFSYSVDAEKWMCTITNIHSVKEWEFTRYE